MPVSSHLGLPFLEAGQAQKHVTHNEALRILDALVQLSVIETLSSPPGSPADGARYIVAASASGAFASHENKIAIYEDSAWRFLTPRAGWRAWSEDAGALLVWTGSEWEALEGSGLGGFDPDDVPHIYVNDAAPVDAEVKLAVRGEAALLHAIPAAESGSGDVRLQISKETAGDTASVFFATGFEGRAEFGLAGSDNFKLKVSADGSTWTEALDIDNTTGRVRLPAVLALTDADQVAARRDIREKLSAHRTYYVRTDGSDGNSGLSNTSGGAFLTIGKALSVAAGLDCGIYNLTIEVADGAYNATVALPDMLGSGTFLLKGNISTPANVTITVSGSCVEAAPATAWRVRGFKLSSTGASAIVSQVPGSKIYYSNIDFGACSLAHVYATYKGHAQSEGNTSISGGAVCHWLAQFGGTIADKGRTITLSGTPAFSSAFAQANVVSAIDASGNTFSGSATGTRYAVSDGAVIFTFFGGATYLPGNATGTGGTTSGGGFYS